MDSPLLGDIVFAPASFEGIDSALLNFDQPSFIQLSSPKRFQEINALLLRFILAAPAEAFLLPHVIDYIDRINQKHLLKENYTLSQFEFWLNQFSGLSQSENYLVRAKIAGKYLPREEYQSFFPIGMNKIFSGTHIVTAHFAPDIDTMIASFWGWVDAFACRVGDGLHLWSLPGGPPNSPVTEIFRSLLGKSVFQCLARTNSTLTLNAMDLVTQFNFVKEKPGISISTLDHGFNEKAVILVDEQGLYRGDWRSHDVEPIRQIIILFKSCLHWFETNLHVKLIALFAKEEFLAEEIPRLLSSIFDRPIHECEPAGEFSDKQKADLDALLTKVLGVKAGLFGTFNELNEAFEKTHIKDLSAFRHQLDSLRHSDLFDSQGRLIEDRTKIFNHLQKIFKSLNKAIHRLRDFVENLDIVMQIKSKVLGKTPHFLILRNEVEDIRSKMSNYAYLTVVVPESEGNLYPVGVVWARDIQKNILGTVSFRDFGNFEEVKMASYLSVISIVDHHKSNFRTNSPPVAMIGDTQSCNILVAEACVAVNRKYSQGGFSKEQISSQLESLSKNEDAPSLRKTQRLLQKKMAAETRGPYFIHPQREMLEYFCFLQAILDDTDLLTKVSNRDIECTAALLNELKSISLGREIEIIDLNQIPRDPFFAKNGAKLILQNPDMYSLYRNIYACKEKTIEDSLRACHADDDGDLFSDTKEQNGCCRVGQIKIFSSTYPHFVEKREILRKRWHDRAQQVYTTHPEIDFHLLMISTISRAEEVYNGQMGEYGHADELWIWIPDTSRAYDHLEGFLSAFQALPEVRENSIEINAPFSRKQLTDTLERNFLPLPIKKVVDLDFIVLKYKAGSINSRKTLISPCLPRLIP